MPLEGAGVMTLIGLKANVHSLKFVFGAGQIEQKIFAVAFLGKQQQWRIKNSIDIWFAS